MSSKTSAVLAKLLKRLGPRRVLKAVAAALRAEAARLRESEEQDGMTQAMLMEARVGSICCDQAAREVDDAAKCFAPKPSRRG